MTFASPVVMLVCYVMTQIVSYSLSLDTRIRLLTGTGCLLYCILYFPVSNTSLATACYTVMMSINIKSSITINKIKWNFLKMKIFRLFSSIIITALLGLSRLLFSEIDNRVFDNGCSDGTVVFGTKYFLKNAYHTKHNTIFKFQSSTFEGDLLKLMANCYIL